MTASAHTPEHPWLALHGASRRFGTHDVLRQLDVSIHQGEALVIIGESGCGKSVTLKLLCGLLNPSHGIAEFEGRSWSQRSSHQMQRDRLRFGFLFQGAALFDSSNVFENVVFGLRQNSHLSEGELREIVRERLNEVGLPFSVCEKMPAQLSGGMKKRVALARALALTPEIMLYDEPTTGLDPVMTDVINELILQVRSRRPVTSIIVTHEMSTVRKVADRIVMLYPLNRLAPDEPQIIYDGPPEGAFESSDSRIRNFVLGQAGERLRELALAG